MTSSVLHPPAHLPPSVALSLSQQAPTILRPAPPANVSISNPISFLTSLIGTAETAELWTTYENLMLSCLRTGDEASAEQCLRRLTARFGGDNERILALSGLFQEATATSDQQLEKILKSYEGILKNDPGNMPITKRRIALLRSLGRIKEAIEGLNSFLEISPTDAEAWSELAELYINQGLYTQGIFALEEVLLVTPNAWNVNARLGEVQYIAAQGIAGGNPGEAERLLVEALRRFCRSIELCDDYLRGYYGLKTTSSHLLRTTTSNNKQLRGDEALNVPDTKILQALNEKATEKLSEIVRRRSSEEDGWQGYDRAEVIAAKALLDKDASKITH